jgi:hypothetical protein
MACKNDVNVMQALRSPSVGLHQPPGPHLLQSLKRKHTCKLTVAFVNLQASAEVSLTCLLTAVAADSL